MAERPHSRKAKIEEGIAEVKKREKLQTQVRASERTSDGCAKEDEPEKGNRGQGS